MVRACFTREMALDDPDFRQFEKDVLRGELDGNRRKPRRDYDQEREAAYRVYRTFLREAVERAWSEEMGKGVIALD